MTPTAPEQSSASAAHEHKLWMDLQSAGTRWSRDQLLTLYEPLARAIAARMYRSRIDESVSFDDYLQYGRLGLIDAIQRFDFERGATFSSFSSARIRGAILNGLARESELSAQRRFRRMQAQDRLASLKDELTRDAKQATLGDLTAIAVGMAIGALLEGDDAALTEVADPNPSNNPYVANEFDQLVRATRALIGKLPDREQSVIGGHYLEQMDFKTLAERMQLSKGRVSQLHAQGLQRLRRWLMQSTQVDRRL